MDEVNKTEGGLAHGKLPEDIAAHHKIDLSTIQAQINKGIKVEREHTSDDVAAEKIAKDHLWENPKYYDYLEDMEDKMDDEAKKCDDKTIAGQTKEVVMPDGKVERTFPGERLAKPIKKSLKETWDLLKAKISANDAFLPLEFFTGPDEKPEDQAQEGQDQEQPQEGQEQGQPQESQLSPEEEAQLNQVKPEDVAPEEGQEGQGQNDQENQLSPEEEQQLNAVNPEDVSPEGQPQEEPAQGEESRYYKGMSQKEMAQAMLEDGHSEQEVLYAIKGHIPYSPTMDDHKAQTEKLMGQQKVDYASKEAEAKHQHMKEIHDIEKKRKLAELESMDPEFTKEHQKALKGVELERAKKALDAEDHEGEKAHKAKLRDLELQAKKEELEAKSSKQKLDYEKKMQELEYHKKKLEIELDIEYKRKENELKLQQKKEMLKQSTAQKKEIADVKHEANKSEAVSVKKED